MLPIFARRTAVSARAIRLPARHYSLFSRKPEQPRLRIGSEAPNFQADSSAGPIDFHKFLGGKWTVFFSHPADFTPICTTELGAFAREAPEFAKLNTQLIGLSADSLKNHKEWISDIEEHTSCNAKVGYPIISDTDRKVAWLYDMVDEEGAKNLQNQATTIRNVFVIDPAKKIRLIMIYPASTGRNVSEVLRVVEALQLTDKAGVVTPVNWTHGEDVILPPSVSTEEGKKKFGDVRELKSYLRYVKAE